MKYHQQCHILQIQKKSEKIIEENIQSSKDKMVENILEQKLTGKETQAAIEKSKKYNFKKNDYCIYIPTQEKVKILEVYHSKPPYYLIEMPDKREKQTIIERLGKINPEVLYGCGRKKKNRKITREKR